MKRQPRKAFTLIELLVVISVIAVVIGILLPALGKVRQQGRALLGMSNQRQIVAGVNCYALDNDENYPPSMATITFGRSWHWQDPRMMTACKPRPSRTHRSMSAFLRSYIEDADVMFCPSTPVKYEYLQQAW
ncbi:MAG: prepilin-type N-terminal cleavage/methylation domain-containing protein, partial [Phycisphaerales bacterium]